jgi:uncharacterized membrane-anchored protein YjiN (DUF445 family)
MVGAIADWFAVTAIFRHPLGLRIPHTAIIPTRKAALARSFHDFFTDNFLAESVIRTRVADARVSSRVGAWLREHDNSTWVADEAATLVSTVLRNIKDDDVAALLETELLPRLADEPLSEVTGRLLREVVDDKAHHGLVDLALAEVHRWLLANREAVALALSTRAPWWSPVWLDEQVTTKLHAEATAWVADIREDPQHHARLALDDLLQQLAQDLQHDPATIERAERLKQRVLRQPQVAATATSLWNAFRRALLESLAEPESAVKARAVVALTRFGARLVDDEALRTRLDGYAADAAAFLVARYGDELSTVITDTIDRWDGKEAAERIELFVGRDLQFIRVNGTVVGALAGVVIHAVALLLG